MGIKNSGYMAFATICKLLKTLRIRKIYSNISRRNFTVETKALYKIIFLSFLICVYTHIIGCIMWSTLKTDYKWVAPTDFGVLRSRMQDPWYQTDDNNVNQINELRDNYDLFIFQWLSMWYHSALTLMLVEVTARSENQIICLVGAYLINAIFNAILFGIYFDLLEAVRRRQNEF